MSKNQRSARMSKDQICERIREVTRDDQSDLEQSDLKGIAEFFKNEHGIMLSQSVLRHFLAIENKCCRCPHSFDTKRDLTKHLNKRKHWMNLDEHKEDWKELCRRFKSEADVVVNSYADAHENINHGKAVIPPSLQRSFYAFLYVHYCLKKFKKPE